MVIKVQPGSSQVTSTNNASFNTFLQDKTFGNIKKIHNHWNLFKQDKCKMDPYKCYTMCVLDTAHP